MHQPARKKRTKRARCRGLKKGIIIDRLANGQSAGMIAAVEQVSRGMVYHYKRILGL